MRHLPRNPDGSPAWHNPADSADVLEQLAREKAAGATALVIPSASFWWLDHYPGLAEHLQRDCRRLSRDSDCIVYRDLDSGRPTAGATTIPATPLLDRMEIDARFA